MARLFGSSDIILGPVNSVFDTTPATLAFWMNTTQSTSNVEFASRHSASSSLNGFGLIMNNTAGKLQLYGKNASTQVFGTNGSATVNDGKWHHVALVVDTSTTSNANICYVDGVVDATMTASAGWSMSGQALRFGKSNDTFWSGYVGNIAEAAWWNVKLTAAEIAALAGGIIPARVRPGSLQLYAPMWN